MTTKKNWGESAYLREMRERKKCAFLLFTQGSDLTTLTICAPAHKVHFEMCDF